MKNKLLLTFLFLMSAHILFGQTRKYISQFSNAQSYFNPSLTGMNGASINSVVRNQWTGFDGAAKTFLLAADFDFGAYEGSENDAFGKSAVGIVFLSDEFGIFKENNILINYSTRIKVSERGSFRVGAGVNFNGVTLDGNNLTVEQINDPIVNQYLGRFAKMNFVDFNLGVSFTNENYYVGYSVQNVNKGSIRSGDAFLENIPSVSVFSGGYRNKFSEKLSIYTNILYRLQPDKSADIEFDYKLAFKETFWIGFGHRIDYSNNIRAGVVYNKFRFGYLYELPMLKSYLLPSPTHEFMVSIDIFGKQGYKVGW
jgi:type IX secretion system PorP/SprF family membrane protein